MIDKTAHAGRPDLPDPSGDSGNALSNRFTPGMDGNEVGPNPGRVGRFLNRHFSLKWWFLAIALVIFAVALPLSRKLQFDRSITALFAANDPALGAYQELQRDFGGNSVAMLVYRDESLWTEEGIKRNGELTQKVAEIAGVDGVISPSVLNELVTKVRPTSFLSRMPPLLDRGDGVSRGFDQLFMGYTHSPDHQYGAVVAMLDPEQASLAIAELRKLSQDWESKPAMTEMLLVGEPVLIEESFALIQRDGNRLATLTVALLSVVLLVSLLDIRFVILAMLTIGWSVVVTCGSLQALGIQLSLVSTILTAIVTVIAVTAVLHMGVRYRVCRRRGQPTRSATAITIGLLAMPIIWTCGTDAAGFAALGVSQILPVQQFGLMIAIASVAVLCGLALFAPAAMTIPSPDFASRFGNRLRLGLLSPLQRWLRRSTGKLARFSIQRPGVLLLFWLPMCGIAIVGLNKTETETTFLNNFRTDSSIVSQYDTVEKQFGGAGVWDVIVDAPTVMTSGFLKSVRQLERDLRSIDLNGIRLTKVISIADADLVVSRSRLMRLVSPEVRLQGMQMTMPVFYDALLTSPQGVKQQTEQDVTSKRRLRLMLRSQENINAEDKLKLIAEVRRIVESSSLAQAIVDDSSSDPASNEVQAMAAGSFSPKVTGYYVLMTQLIDQLITDGWRCLVASSVLVWALLIFSGRSIKRATIALVVNLLPAFLVLSSVGWTGGKINMGSAMIAAVSIGLSIDGSVHFLAAYRRKRKRGHDARTAAVFAAGSIGVPIVLATIALIIGFGGLVTSEFVPTSTFGTLVAATLAVGTLVNLTLLPGLIGKLDR